MGQCRSCSGQNVPVAELDVAKEADNQSSSQNLAEVSVTSVLGTADQRQDPVTLQQRSLEVPRPPEKDQKGAEEQEGSNTNDIATCTELAKPSDNGADLARQISGEVLARSEDEFGHIKRLCLEARVLEAGAKLKALELELASTVKVLSKDISDPMYKLLERLSNDPVLKKLRLVYPRIERQLLPDALLSVALRDGKDAWIVGKVHDPSIGEHFSLEIKVRWLEGSELDKNGPYCQFILSASASGWPQPPENFVALARELDLGKKELVQDCTDYKGTPGGAEQLMSAMVRYVIRPALCPVNLEFVLSRELAVMEDALIPGYPSGVMILEEAMPTGVDNYEGWPVPPTKWGYVRMTQTLVWHVSPSLEHPGCSNCRQVGRYGAALPKFMCPLTLIHKVCLTIIHKTLKRLIDGALPEWDKAHGPRMQRADVRGLYGAIATLSPSSN